MLYISPLLQFTLYITFISSIIIFSTRNQLNYTYIFTLVILLMIPYLYMDQIYNKYTNIPLENISNNKSSTENYSNFIIQQMNIKQPIIKLEKNEIIENLNKKV